VSGSVDWGSKEYRKLAGYERRPITGSYHMSLINSGEISSFPIKLTLRSNHMRRRKKQRHREAIFPDISREEDFFETSSWTGRDIACKVETKTIPYF
jgi:hypothetical protein